MTTKQRTQPLRIRARGGRSVLTAGRDLVRGGLYDDGLIQPLAGEAGAADHAAASVTAPGGHTVSSLKQAVA